MAFVIIHDQLWHTDSHWWYRWIRAYLPNEWSIFWLFRESDDIVPEICISFRTPRSHQLLRDLAMSWCIANVPCRNICLWNVCPPIKFVEFSCDQLSYILLAANFTCLILVVAHFSCWLWNWWDLDCGRNSINTCYLFVIYAPIKQRWRNKEHWFGGCSVLSDLKMEKELKLETGATIRSRIRDLVPNGTKVPKWSQKSPDFASKSQISDSTFRCCWKEEAHSSKSLLCPN